MSAPFDRRAFLGGAAAAGAIAAAAAVPLTARALALIPAAVPPANGKAPAADADWHIDDMWGHAPRYAHPIPHSPMRTSPISWEHVDPIDRFLVL